MSTESGIVPIPRSLVEHIIDQLDQRRHINTRRYLQHALAAAPASPPTPAVDKRLADEIYQEVDGYYVWDTGKGYLNAHYLRQIADELDRRNAEWGAEIRREIGEPK